MKTTLFCKVKWDGEKLIPVTKADQIKFDMYLKNFKENSDFDMMLTLHDEVKSYPQLQRIHKGIREVADFSGQTFEEVKNYVKAEANLYDFSDGESELKSFAKCTKKELDSAIKVLEVFAANIDCVLTV